MYIGHACLCVSVPRRIPTLLHGPRCNVGNGRRCPSVVYYWVDLQSVHGFRCYDNIAPNMKSECVLVLSVCLVICIAQVTCLCLIIVLAFGILL